MFVKVPENDILKGEINLPFLNKKKFDSIEDNLLMAVRQLRASTTDEPQGRKLKIRTGWRPIQTHFHGLPIREFPEILIKGSWLKKYGFAEKRYIHVFPYQKVLVICQE